MEGVKAMYRSSRNISPAQTPSPQTAMPWDAIEEASPAALIARLRAAGCPEQTTRWIVAFRVCRQYRERWLAWQAKAARAWDYTRKLEEYLYRLSPAADYVRNNLPPAK